MSKYLSFLFLVAFTFFVSCKKDSVDPCDDLNATYSGAVKSIIDNTCAYSGCHDGTGVNTFIPTSAADYTTYSGMEASLNSGAFNTRALVSQDMPPAAFVPAGSPTELTAAQLEILNCWMDAGYPEN